VGLQKVKHRHKILELHKVAELQRIRLARVAHLNLNSQAQILHERNKPGLRLFIAALIKAGTQPPA
jgi:hypothetical protein